LIPVVAGFAKTPHGAPGEGDPFSAVFFHAARGVPVPAVDSFGVSSDDERKGARRGSSSGLDHHSPILIPFGQSGSDMGIYDREYYRGEPRGRGWFAGVAPVCKTIIVINAIVFLFEQLAQLDPALVDKYFAASPGGTLRNYQLWQLLTATFFHADIWHILANMWFLWMVGREMEALYGSRDFLAFYLAAAIVSTLVWVVTAAFAPQSQFMVGASGAVMAVVMLFTLYFPKREILFIVVPMPMWVLLVIYLLYPLLFVLNGSATNIAISSHLAGAGFAFLFKQFDLRFSRLFSRRVFKPRVRISTPVPRETTRSRAPNPARTSASVGGSAKSAAVSVIPEEQLDARLDEVLAKIAREGRAGLSEEELRVLQEASRRARIRRSDRL
jgi:membrane associated rhomboid family serine protease